MSAANAGFELRDHTADIALYAWGDSMDALFRSAAEGLYATIGELRCTTEGHPVALHLEAGDAESLLHDFLAELHYRFETAGERVHDFVFHRLDEGVLDAGARAATVDRAASIFDREVKAVTYHDIEIVHDGGRYEVTLILDI